MADEQKTAMDSASFYAQREYTSALAMEETTKEMIDELDAEILVLSTQGAIHIIGL